MDAKNLDVALAPQESDTAQICELNEVQLALIGGGIGKGLGPAEHTFAD